MNIIEVKNNLVKLCYEEDISLSGFLLIRDTQKSYIVQVLHLEATRVGKIAVAKLIFNFDGEIHAYDGSIPSLRAEVENFDTVNLLKKFEHSNPLTLGKIAGKKDNLVVDFEILKDNPIILAEKFFTTKVLLNNLALQLQARKEKIVVFDTMGVFKTNKMTITKDFKLPLNNSTINYIYEKGFEDATAESKSMIQAVFEELSEYSKTVEFIPFDTFKTVVDSEFMRTKLMQLVIMKNRIKQIRDWNVFAQRECEFKVLKNKLENDNTVVIDISCLKESLQKECIKYVYSVLKEINSEFFVFTPLTTENSDKFLLNQILDLDNIHTSLICDYDYVHLTELKKRSKNMLMFTPLKQQKDFGGYNVFLQKLAEDEFVAYGKMTKFVPLISKLFQMTKDDVYVPQVNETLISFVNENISANVEVEVPDNPEVVEEISSEDIENESVIEEEDVSEDENVVADISEDTENVIKNESVEQPVDEVTEPENVVTEQINEQIPEESPPEQASEIEDHKVEIETTDVPSVEELNAPEVETVMTPEVQISQMAGASAESVEIPLKENDIESDVNTEVDVDAEQDVEPESEPEIIPESEPEMTPEPQHDTVNEPVIQDEVQSALDSVPDVEDEELSDDDLDMIEKLSKPDEEIPIINPEPVQEEPVIAEESVVEEPVAAEPVEEQIVNGKVTEQIVQQPEQMPTVEPQQDSISDDINSATMPKPSETLETRAKTTPSVPEYSAEFPDEDRVNSDVLQQGDRVFHEEFGEGIVEKMINYGDKILCSVNFTSVGRRLLNPEISEMKKLQ